MNILILGSGGREHALAWKVSQSYHCDQLFIAPGNAGTATLGTNVAMSVTDFAAQKQFCLDNNINIVIVGPEEPLVLGIYDFFKSDEELKNIIVVGPSGAAAQLEGSKSFAKTFMFKHGIPTAAYAEFTITNYNEGKDYIKYHSLPIVLKADGLAAGKGVVICHSHKEALEVFESMIIGKQFGEASHKVVIEAFLDGIEISVFALTNGKDYQIIGHAKDYKRIGEGDKGLNTGGMGCVSPVPFADDAFMNSIEETIIKPTIKGLQEDGLVYFGFVFFGLIKCKDAVKVIEYNCRLGDPETEVILPRLETDLVALFAAMDNGTLEDVNINFSDKSFATVVAVSGGYPGEYKKHLPVSLPDISLNEESIIFHAGTIQHEDNIVLTNGGRVLAVTSEGKTIKDAVELSLAILEDTSFDEIYYRKDIGYEFE